MSQMKESDMLAALRFSVDSGNIFIPEIYQSLRRRRRLLRDHLMYMGSWTAFADYFPLWTTTSGRRRDVCKSLTPLESLANNHNARRTAWQSH